MSSDSRFEISPPKGDDEIREFADVLEESLSFPSFDEHDIGKHEGRSNMRLARDGGRVVGGLVMRRLGQWFGGRVVPMSGIRAVGVSAEYRGAGLGQALVRGALAEMREAGVALSVLYPATQPVYRRCGFEQGGVWITYKMAASAFDGGDRSLKMRRIETADHEEIRRVYGERARRSAGHVERDDWVWGRVFNPRQGKAYGYLVEGDSGCEGYVVFYKRQPDGPFYDLVLTDWVANTPGAGRRLLTFFADHRSMCKEVFWQGPSASSMLLLQREQAQTTVERLDWMLRIVDVVGALEGRGYGRGLSGELHLEVRDDVLTENAGRYVLEVSDGRGRVREGGRGGLRVDVRGLASMYTGHLGANDLRASGYVDGAEEDIAMAESVFAGSAPWMPDIF